MYQISNENGILGYTETADYCYKLPSGSPQIIGRKERERGETATGIVYGGTVYNLPGHDDFDGKTAWVSEVNAANVLNEQARQLAEQSAVEDDLDAMTVDHELRLAFLEEGLEGGDE